MPTKKELEQQRDDLIEQINAKKQEALDLETSLDQALEYIRMFHPDKVQQRAIEDEMRVKQTELADVEDELRKLTKESSF